MANTEEPPPELKLSPEQIVAVTIRIKQLFTDALVAYAKETGNVPTHVTVVLSDENHDNGITFMAGPCSTPQCCAVDLLSAMGAHDDTGYDNMEAVEHTDHPPGVTDLGCPACQRDITGDPPPASLRH